MTSFPPSPASDSLLVQQAAKRRCLLAAFVQTLGPPWFLHAPLGAVGAVSAVGAVGAVGAVAHRSSARFFSIPAFFL